MFTGERHLVVARELFEHLDVADQARPGEAPFEEIVAEKGVLRDSPGQRRFERVDLVYAFAGIDPTPNRS